MEGLVNTMFQDLKKFYKGKKVLMTGHTGFKGAWLSLWLLELGAEVAGYALEPNTDPSLYGILGLEGRMISGKGDIRDKGNFKSFFMDFRPEIVIHMAAQSLVRNSYEEPVATYETNVIGTVNMFEVCRESSFVRSVVNVTSDKCYENHGENRPYSESDPMGGYDPYSSSKGCAELVAGAYSRSFFSAGDYGKRHNTALASVRSGNVIGGGDWNKDRLVPDCLKAAMSGKETIIRYPDAVRPWQHVLEPLCGYLLLAKKLYEEGPGFSGAWNFGPGEKNEKPVKWILEKINESWEGGLSWKVVQKPQLHEASYLRLDSKKAGSLLGWHPRMDLSLALRKTIEWYKAWQDKIDMHKYSSDQIEEYMRGGKA
ncbi:MAG: CDP-glucose 4,6-dehydratase [Candidatus Tantalella remota]|nr:CDP-glucose 4,6-dehydratase [Candidatus Tantalella remota]